MVAELSLTRRRKRLLLSVISLASFMGALDATIVNISLPTISAYFGARMGLVSWVVIGYLLVLSSSLLLFGRLGDLRGFRPVFLGGFTIFTLGSLLCGLSGEITHLIAFRILQGIGAAALQAIGPAMVALYLPEKERGRAFGVLATAVSLGIAGGPILGGFLTEYLSWHWIFFINVPIGALALAMGSALLPRPGPVDTGASFDAPGAALLFLALLTLLLPLSDGIYLGWNSPMVIGSAALSLVFWTSFIVRELRCRDPLVDLHLFSNRDFTFANMAGFLVMAALSGCEFLLPFFFERVAGLATSIAGLLLAVPALALMVTGLLSGTLSDRYGCRPFAAAASLLAAGTFLLLSTFSGATTIPFVVATLICLGVAVGFFFPPNMSQILGQCRREEQGVGSGVMNTMKNLGDTLGIALFGTVALAVIGAQSARLPGVPAASLPPDILVSGFRVAFIAGIVLCLAAAAMSALARDVSSRVGEEESQAG
jgi:EmrB/QacA subfamily drug resistance transporter